MKKILKRMFLPFVGLSALVWFLVRVIPKPSRAAYPCMRVAAPLASTFVLYLIGFTSSMFLFKKAKNYFYQARYILFSVALVVGIGLVLFTSLHSDKKAFARSYTLVQSPPDGSNNPMGTGVGINPGRVVWEYDPRATNENCTNKTGDYWWQSNNTNQTVVNQMLSDGLKMLTNENSDAAAWDAIFRYYNKNHGKGDVGYKAGEKIVIKINLNAGAGGTAYDISDYRKVDTSPQIVYAVLNELVNIVGVAQADIGFGDPGRNVDNLFWDKFHAEFPDVKYWGAGNGRTPIVKSKNFEIFTSDGSYEDWLPQCYLDAAYMINLPILKKHHRGGVSMTSKNHFGTFVPFHGGANNWHFSLPASEGGGDVNNGDYGLYRCFVDFIGHKSMGGKTILYLIDGIWGSTNWAHPPIKWRMSPFNNDWPSSLLMSQDPVAIESVGFDFLFKEFDETHPTEGAYDRTDNRGPFPHYAGTDDFLHQAADSKNWPTGIKYDPEKDGTILPNSMGVHEHWNNPEEKKYSRNLGLDKGIELVSNYTPSDVKGHSEAKPTVQDFALYQNYPNPFNGATTITYDLSTPAEVTLYIHNTSGQRIRTLVNERQNPGFFTARWDGLLDNGTQAPSGVYFYSLRVGSDKSTSEQVIKMTLSK